MVKSYRDTLAWQKVMDLAVAAYAITRRLPNSEKFGLISRLRCAAVSGPSVLPEGHARSSTKEFVRYIPVSMTSPAEIETQLMIARKLGFIDSSAVDPPLDAGDEEGRVLRGLSKSLGAKFALQPLISSS